MVLPSVSEQEAKNLFPKGIKVEPMKSKKPYMRFTPDPR